MKNKGVALFTCDFTEDAKAFPHFWEHTVGSGYAPLGLRADWQSQLEKTHDELGFRHVRFHGILSDDMGTLICQKGELLYSFFNADQIFDFLLSIGMRPFVELSFMPATLASGDKTVFSYAANVTPPQENSQWCTLVSKLVQHWVQRYGRNEVRQWYFEIWNEPNLEEFWTGSQDEYFEFYRDTANTIKDVDKYLQVGGPATAKNEWIPQFLDYCEHNGVPVDFVSTHHYPTDAFGQEGDDTETQLSKSKRSVLRDQARKAHNQAKGKPLFYTEWNSSSNPRDHLHDEPYSAAFITKTIMEATDLVDGYSYWTFSDIFCENYFPSVPFHGGFGLLNLHGIPKPTYRAYQLLHQLGREKLTCRGSHKTVDAWVVKKRDGVTILLTNHALPHHSIETEQVEIQLTGSPSPKSAIINRIDEHNCNPQRLWHRMGEPEYLSSGEVKTLQTASELCRQSLPLEYQNQTIYLHLDLPPHGVASVDISF